MSERIESIDLPLHHDHLELRGQDVYSAIFHHLSLYILIVGEVILQGSNVIHKNQSLTSEGEWIRPCYILEDHPLTPDSMHLLKQLSKQTFLAVGPCTEHQDWNSKNHERTGLLLQWVLVPALLECANSIL
jgi:hypothetical protein